MTLGELLAEETERACHEFMEQAEELAEHLVDNKPYLQYCDMKDTTTGSDIVSNQIGI